MRFPAGLSRTLMAHSSDFRLGVIGIDSSHLPAFSDRIHKLHADGETQCRVTRMWTDGRHDLPEEHVAKWRQQAMDLGVKPAESMDELLDDVDGVMVLSVNGNRHLEHTLPALQRGLPTYVDKPLTCTLAEARQLLDAARRGNARCYSASSLRFVAELEQLDLEKLGRIVAVDAVGPGELNESMEGLFFYGVHAIELVDAIAGPGVAKVSAVHTPDRDLVRLAYHDGRFANIRLERVGGYAFGATVHGEIDMQSFVVDFGPVYGRLVKGMVRFFEGGPAPVELRDIVENVAVMEAGNRSIQQDGAWVDVEVIE